MFLKNLYRSAAYYCGSLCAGITVFFTFMTFLCYAQTYSWQNPVNTGFPVIKGRYWQNELKQPFDRLPARAEALVRPELWKLSQYPAGEYISFSTNASDIRIKYKAEGMYIPTNSTALLVTGLDLYLRDGNNKWYWTAGTIKLGDTIDVHFENIPQKDTKREYRLYLPTFRKISALLIGVSKNASFAFVKVNAQKPVVVYGTSILQGASASRPGLMWSNILGRKLNREVINLGFSGNGQLEPALLDLINEIDAGVFVLDCLPNLHDRKKFSNAEVEKRLVNAVKTIRSVHPLTPIVLTEHASGIPGVNIDSAFYNKYARVNQVLRTTFKKLNNSGSKHIYLLSADQIAFDCESTIDGTHPTDIGMMKYANAYEKIIKQIIP